MHYLKDIPDVITDIVVPVVLWIVNHIRSTLKSIQTSLMDLTINLRKVEQKLDDHIESNDNRFDDINRRIDKDA